jgi:glucoamylase
VRWLYVVGTDVARAHGVDGYYVRAAQPDSADAASPCDGFVPIKTRPPDQMTGAPASIVSLDALAFVRFGLRAPDDPRIVSTLRIIDATLEIDTPDGPAWRRYQGDLYGEYDGGAPFDGGGVGRAWPLLTGERAHYELAAGRPDEARRLARALEAFAGEAGLLPEQIWDAADVPERELVRGRASGSAMPLVWAHAEYVKLCRSLQDGAIFDRPPQTVERYLVRQTAPLHVSWRFNNKLRAMPEGKRLRIETLAPAVVRWSADGWRTTVETPTCDTTLDVHVADLDTAALARGRAVSFTFYWPEADRWEGIDFIVRVE